jgi:hypothetical protein
LYSAYSASTTAANKLRKVNGSTNTTLPHFKKLSEYQVPTIVLS